MNCTNFKHPMILVAFLAGFLLVFASCEDDDAEPGDDQQQDDDDNDVPGKPYEETVVLDCQITSDLHLEQVEDAPVDYFVYCNGFGNIEAELRIDPGVVIMFAESGYRVSSNGSLIAEGTDDESIIMRGPNEERHGDWLGLEIRSNNPDNSLEHVLLTGAGNGSGSRALYGREGQMSLTHTKIEYSENAGFYVTSDFAINDFAGNHFADNKGDAVALPSNQLGSLDAQTTYDDNNGGEAIFVFGGDVTSDQTWSALGAPVYINDEVEVHAELYIEEGSYFVFDEDGYIDVRDGYMNVGHEDGEPVVFEGSVATPGYWQGITYRSNHPENLLNNVEVYHGKMNIRIEDGQAGLTNSLSAESSQFGFVVAEHWNADAEITVFSNNTFADNSDIGASVRAYNIDALDEESSYNDNNGKDYIEVRSGKVRNDATWRNLDAYYLFTGEPEIESNLTINAGTDLRFKEEQLTVTEEGASITAEGEPGNEIMFRGPVVGANAPVNQWDGIRISSSNPSLLDNIVIAHGGSRNIYLRDNFTFSISNSVVRDSDGYGIEAHWDHNGTYNEFNVTFENHPDGNKSNLP